MGEKMDSKIFRVKHLAFTLCTLAVIAFTANFVYLAFFGETATSIHDILTYEFLGVVDFSTVIIILYVTLSFVSYGLYLELVYMFGVTGNVQIMFIASILTAVLAYLLIRGQSIRTKFS